MLHAPGSFCVCPFSIQGDGFADPDSDSIFNAEVIHRLEPENLQQSAPSGRRQTHFRFVGGPSEGL